MVRKFKAGKHCYNNLGPAKRKGTFYRILYFRENTREVLNSKPIKFEDADKKYVKLLCKITKTRNLTKYCKGPFFSLAGPI